MTHIEAVSPAALLTTVLNLIALGALCWLTVLLIRALRKYLRGSAVRQETAAVRQTLGERIKARRTERGMTQEFVAETLGVSRQAVSKWESGTADPSTHHLIALAKLLDIPPEELLRNIDTQA